MFLPIAALQADCDKVIFSDVGWTDITTTTSIAKQVLEALGYKVDVKVLAVPVTFASLKSDDIDVFLGQLDPGADHDAVEPYLKAARSSSSWPISKARNTRSPSRPTPTTRA